MPATAQPEPVVKTDVLPTSRSETPTRTINVEVPNSVYWHIRKCAIESQLSMKDYMSKFCMEAFPYRPVQSQGETANR